VLADWRNWSGNQRATPSSVEHPRDVEEVSLAVKRAVAEGRRMRPVGAALALTNLGDIDLQTVACDLDRHAWHRRKAWRHHDELDPGRVFTNPYLDTVLGT
jgi:hypothetical protein